MRNIFLFETKVRRSCGKCGEEKYVDNERLFYVGLGRHHVLQNRTTCRMEVLTGLATTVGEILLW